MYPFKCTSHLSTVGTIETCAPEVLKSGRYSLQSDVYSFGIVFYEFLFLADLYPNMSAAEVQSGVIGGLRPDIPTNIGNISQKAIDIIRECWQAEPEKRPSFVQILDRLEQIIKNHEIANPHEIALHYLPRRKTSTFLPIMEQRAPDGSIIGYEQLE